MTDTPLTAHAPAATAAAERPWRRPNALAWLILPCALMFALFFILPLGLMLVMSFLTGNPVVQDDVTFTLEHYERFATDSYNWDVLWVTLKLGFFTTLATLLLGYPLAHWMARVQSGTVYVLLLVAVLAPMLTGIVVRTFAWMAILQDSGVINTALISLGLIDKPIAMLNNETGIVIGLTHIYIPYMVLTLNGVISRIDERLEQAAQNLGASPLRAFREVTLPLSMPGIFAGSLLVFALSISAYVTPLLMGGFQIMTLPLLIYQQISASFNIGFAAALGIILLVISLGLIVAYNRVLGALSGDRSLS